MIFPNQNSVKAELDPIGLIYGTATYHPNGGVYCAPKSEVCAIVVVYNGEICVVPQFAPGVEGPEKIKVTPAELEAIENGAVFYTPPAPAE